MIRPTLLLAAVPLAVVALPACSDNSGGNAVDVMSTSSACTPERTSFDAGKLTFKVTNKGSKPTELYVYGAGDHVIGEVENVGPGTARSLSVNLKAGTYQLACKPGQVGKGIRVPITVTGSGGEASSEAAFTEDEADTEAPYTLRDYQFAGPETVKGPKVFFEATNAADQTHELVVKDETGKTVDEVEVPAGETRRLAAELPAGNYSLVCELEAADGRTHEQHGMKADLAVS